MNKQYLELIVVDYLSGSISDDEVRNITELILNNEQPNEYKSTKREKIIQLSNLYEENSYLFEEENLVKIDMAMIRFFSNYFNIRKKNLLEKYVIDGYISEFMIIYLAFKQEIKINMDLIHRVENNLEIKLNVLNLDPNILKQRHHHSLDEIGALYNISRERVRQIEKASKEYIKELCDYPAVDYYYIEDIDYLTTIEQAIVYSFKEDTYNESFKCFVYDQETKSKFDYVENLFINLEEQNDKTINRVYSLFIDEIKRYIKLNNRFYIADNKVFAHSRLKKKLISNYFVNYLENFKIIEFSLDQNIINDFKKTYHAKMYEEKTSAEINLKNLGPNLDREQELTKIGISYYTLNVKEVDKFGDSREYFIEQINNNLPIKSISSFSQIFSEYIIKEGILAINLYYILKSQLADEFKFYNYSIYKKGTVIKSEMDQVIEVLLDTGKSKFNITNSTAYKQKFKKSFKENTFVIRGEWIYNYKLDPNYQFMKDLMIPDPLPDIYLKKDFISELKKYSIDISFYNNDYDAAFKIWCKQHDLRFKHLFATKKRLQLSISDVVFEKISQQKIISADELDQAMVDVGITRNLYQIINRLISERKISRVGTGVYRVKTTYKLK